MQLLFSSITCALLAGSRVPTTPQPLLAATALKRAPSPLLQQQTEEKGFSCPFRSSSRACRRTSSRQRSCASLKKQPFMQWAADEEYTSRLGTLYQAISLFLSLPVAYTTFYNLPGELPNLLVAANLGTIAAMIPFVIRLRVGWGFVSQRLKSSARHITRRTSAASSPRRTKATCCATSCSSRTRSRPCCAASTRRSLAWGSR